MVFSITRVNIASSFPILDDEVSPTKVALDLVVSTVTIAKTASAAYCWRTELNAKDSQIPSNDAPMVSSKEEDTTGTALVLIKKMNVYMVTVNPNHGGSGFGKSEYGVSASLLLEKHCAKTASLGDLFM
ncbi:uncharacterized protein LOC142764846 [Rhipicephalus microplus]|uniref:uncharacterized protein LOC142764846 n=1 Tax=Rhipicephalus microplus TaxID=6941 RepID=UPI003F6A6E0E